MSDHEHGAVPHSHAHDHPHGHGHAHDHAHEHGHPHDHALDPDHGERPPRHWHGHDPGPLGERPRLPHSFLVPHPYPSRSSLRLQPLEELHPSHQKRFREVIARHSNAHAEPFRGVTVDGNVVPGLFSLAKTGISLQPVLEAARAFLDTLSRKERLAVRFDIDGVEWRQWSNGHAYHFRHGLCLQFLTGEQREAALRIVRETLSAAAFTAVRDIMRLNEHVLELTGRADEFGEWHYYISIFGEPSAEAPWGWQMDGHHINIHCFIIGDQMVMTPNFLGSEPTYAESGKYKGTRVMQDEETRGYELMRSLSRAQRDYATISEQIPAQVFTIAPWDNKVLEHRGVGFADLDARQQRLMLELIELYTGRVRPGHAQIEFDTVTRFLKQTKFAWAGPCDDVSPFYYRVHSPVIVIEFDHQSGTAFQDKEPGRHHVHTIVRTPNGNDYGRDLLRQHYLQYAHKPVAAK